MEVLYDPDAPNLLCFSKAAQQTGRKRSRLETAWRADAATARLSQARRERIKAVWRVGLSTQALRGATTPPNSKGGTRVHSEPET